MPYVFRVRAGRSTVPPSRLSGARGTALGLAAATVPLAKCIVRASSIDGSPARSTSLVVHARSIPDAGYETLGKSVPVREAAEIPDTRAMPRQAHIRVVISRVC